MVQKDGSIRIYGDYKVTVNKASKVETYPLPKIDELSGIFGGWEDVYKVGSYPCLSTNYIG